MDWEKLIGLKGTVIIELRDDWWTILSPQQLDMVLTNLYCNPTPPMVTIVKSVPE